MACGNSAYGELLTLEANYYDAFLPTETEIKENATFCYVVNCTSSVFIGIDTLKSPNRRITLE